MYIKQVIVIRKDLNMRKGKMAAQAAHASMIFLVRTIKTTQWDRLKQWFSWFLTKEPYGFTDEQLYWINNSFTKVVVSVNSEEELDEIYSKASKAGLVVHQIVDNGTTEFNGIKTKTCLAIGPHEASKIDEITGHLTLL